MAASGAGAPRAQAAVEFLAMAALGGAVLAAAAVLSLDYSNFSLSERLASGGNDLCLLLAREVNVAAQMGEGYDRTFALPVSTLQFNYSVGFDNNLRRVAVDWGSGNCFGPLVVNVTGTLSPGSNRLRTQGGVVMLNS